MLNEGGNLNVDHAMQSNVPLPSPSPVSITVVLGS